MTYAPIIVTVYHRYAMFRHCIEALQQCLLSKDSELYIVSDAASTPEHEAIVQQVRNYARAVTGFKAVHLMFREKNLGSYFSVNRAIAEVLEIHDRFILLEDDIIVAPGFLQYLNDGMLFYQNDRRVFAICAFKPIMRIPHGYHAEVFAVENFSPWGFGMWRDRWRSVNLQAYDRTRELEKEDHSLYDRLIKQDPGFMAILREDSEGRLKAGDVRTEYHIYRQGLVSVFPCVSMSANRGCCAGGEHCGGINGVTDVDLSPDLRHLTFQPFLHINQIIQRRYLASKRPGRILTWYMAAKRNGVITALRHYAVYYWRRLVSRF